MTKKELSEALDLSQTTISRYMKLGLPYERQKGRCLFNLDEVSMWKRQHILPTYRTDENEKVPDIREIATWSLNFSLALLNFMEKKCCKDCQKKWFRDVEVGKFYVE